MKNQIFAKKDKNLSKN